MGDLHDLAPAQVAGRRDKLATLLELAAADDADGMKEALAGAGEELADEVGIWYGRSNEYEARTPLMVAATCGSARVVSLLLGLSGSVDVARRPGNDGFTALHCAASGGSCNAVQVVKMLIAAGADPATRDSAGRIPADVLPASPDALADLEMLLGRRRPLTVATSAPSGASSPPLPSSRSSSLAPITVDRAKREYPVDPTLPDIKSSVYASDEFRMFDCKVRPCSRAYSHDWTECPFVHPGENARRRDPRKHTYTALPCPSFRRSGCCPSGDNCEYSHGVFESRLHPTQYRTRLCKEGAACARRICFFAHDEDELRHVTHDSGLLSPRASSIDMTTAALGFQPGSPRHFVRPPGSPSAMNNGAATAAHRIQGSRLLSSFNAKDVTVNDLLDWESQYLRARYMYASDMAMSPRFADQGHSAYSPAHKSAILNKLHQQKGLLAPVNTNRMYSPRYLDPSALVQSPIDGMSPRFPRVMAPTSPLSARFGATQRDMYEQFASLNKQQLPSVGSSPRNYNASWGNVGSPMGKVDWGVDGDELHRLRCQSGFFAKQEPDVAWGQAPNKRSEMLGRAGSIASGSTNRPDWNNQVNLFDQTVNGACLEQFNMDQEATDGGCQVRNSRNHRFARLFTKE